MEHMSMQLIDLNDQRVNLNCKVAPQKICRLDFDGKPIINIIHEFRGVFHDFAAWSNIYDFNMQIL